MAASSTWKRVRKLFNDIHLWMGIGAGLILFVVCFTGTVYTFHHEIDEWFNSEKYHIAAPVNGEEPLSVEELASIVASQVEGTVSAVTLSPTATDSYQFSVRKEGQRRGTTYLVNQYMGTVLGDTKSGASEFFMVMFRLHRWLMLDTKIGRPIVGWSTVIFVFIILTGLVIWVPQKVKSWRQGLKIKWSGNWKRINHDLHNSLGLYTSIFLLIMALTGLQWSFDWYRDGLRSVLGVEAPQRGGGRGPNPNERQAGAPEDSLRVKRAPLSVQALLSVADQALPFEGTYRLDLPNQQKPTINIRKYPTGFFATSASDQLTLDVFSGEVTAKEVFSEKPFNEKIAQSIKALHVGDVFGTFSKIIYFISCLIATSLPVTGTIIWINKLKKKAKRKVKVAVV
jgi:uncharacterized iron-regulated membrane protein